MTVDPLADKYPGWSPYNYVMNNPLVLVDPDGREIRIYTGEKDENGDDIYLTYVAGMEYSGNNQFVLSVVNALNAMNSVEIGAIALRSLIASFNSFNIKNIFSKEKGTAGYIRNINGGGDILAGEFMNQTINTNVQSIAHELFHGLQHENGGIYGVNSEVEAYLFGRAVQASYTQIAVLFNGNGTKIGNVFRDAMNELLFSETFNEKTFNRAVEAFQKGNPYNGLYKKA